MVDGWNAIFGPLVGRPIAEGEFYNLFFYILALLMVILVIFIVVRLRRLTHRPGLDRHP